MNSRRLATILSGFLLLLCTSIRSEKELTGVKENERVISTSSSSSSSHHLSPSSVASSKSSKPSIKYMLKRIHQKAKQEVKPRSRRSYLDNRIPSLPEPEMSNEIPDSMWPYDRPTYPSANPYFYRDFQHQRGSNHGDQFYKSGSHFQNHRGPAHSPFPLDYDDTLDLSPLLPPTEDLAQPAYDIVESHYPAIPGKGVSYDNMEGREPLLDALSPQPSDAFYNAPLDLSAFPDLSGQDTGTEDLDLFDLDLGSLLPQSATTEGNDIMDDFLTFLDLRASGALDKCLGQASTPT